MTILVAIPFYGAPELLPRAVKSALGQTIDDVRVVVYGDGMAPPPLPRDRRLRVHVSPVNRGPYFGLQAMLEASPFELFAPIGADDYVDPDHLERMVPLVEPGAGAVITGRVWWHAPGHPTRTPTVRYEVGLFRRDRLLSFGAYNPAERMGQDSLLVELLELGPHAKTDVPTYHRCLRPDSLSTSATTGNASEARRRLRSRNRDILDRCKRYAHNRRPRALREYRASLVPPRIRAELTAEIELLRAVIA